jgi:hypothetical protein
MKVSKTNYVAEFKEAITKGHEMVHTACVGMVEQVDAHPESLQEYMDAMPNIPKRTWATFERVGRNTMDWRLMMGGVKNESAIRKLPISEQGRLLDGDKVELLLTNGDSLMIDPLTCMKEQVDQVFDKGSIRDLSEQRAFLENEERSWDMVEKSQRTTVKWRVVGARAIVNGACEFSKSELLAMVGEIK